MESKRVRREGVPSKSTERELADKDSIKCESAKRISRQKTLPKILPQKSFS